MKQPYTYSMPESFLKDKNVPACWRVLAIINGFILNGGCFYGSNQWIMEQLNCSQKTVSNAFAELEELHEIRTERTRRTRKVYKTSRDSKLLPSEIVTERSGDSNQLLPNSVSNSEKNISSRVEYVIEEDLPDRKKKPRKDSSTIEVFALFGKYPKSWENNTTQRTSAENLLSDKGIVQIQRAIEFQRENRLVKFCPKINSPWELEMKWADLADFKEKNGL